jgi:ABC-type lipoprotein export system ATPase subunit
LTERRDANPATLSAGERQRVALARALVKRPPLILADEPTGNLDPDNAARVLEHLDHYRRSGGTVVLVTHGSDANRYATQRLRLEAGRWAIPSPFPPFNDSAS